MILSAADLTSRLTHPKNSARNRNLVKTDIRNKRTVDELDRNDKPAGPSLFIRESGSGPRPGDITGKPVPDEIAIPAMVLARLGVNQQEIGSTLGISQGAVSNLKTGKTGSDEAKSTVEIALENIRERVVNKLDRSLDFLTEDKLINAKAIDVASVARTLVGILETTDTKKKESGNDNRVQIVIHGVNQVESNSYEVIEVGS